MGNISAALAWVLCISAISTAAVAIVNAYLSQSRKLLKLKNQHENDLRINDSMLDPSIIEMRRAEAAAKLANSKCRVCNVRYPSL